MSLSSVEIVKTIELDFAFIHLRSDGIVSFWAKTELDNLSVKRIDEIYVAVISLTNNKPSPMFVGVINHMNLSDEEKNAIAAKLPSCITACAIKEESNIIRFLVHTFNYLYRPQIPIKMFKTEEDAVLWLKEF